MAKKPTSPNHLITSLPLTAEAREQLLTELFADKLPHIGELFVPGNGFYVNGNPEQQAKHMVQDLCEWLGVKPGYIGLEFESEVKQQPTKIHIHTIYVDIETANNELLLGAMLAHALVRYVIEEKMQIFLKNTDDQHSLLATGTIVFGLGVVTANGLIPSKKYSDKIKEILGPLPKSEYGAMLYGYIWQHNIPEQNYENCLAPWTATMIGISKSKNPTQLVKRQYLNDLHMRYQTIGISWVVIVGVIVGGFLVLNRVSPPNKQVMSLQQQMRQLQFDKQSCEDQVAYDRLYTDTTDLQAQRAINAQKQRCTSLDNQLKNIDQQLRGQN